MELNLNNEIDNIQGQDSKLTEFMSELNLALERGQELESNGTLYNEMIENVELAPKYAKELQNTIDKCLNNLSYENAFYYFDYDKNTEKYFLDYYNKGEKERFELTEEEIKDYKTDDVTFYRPLDDGRGYMIASESLKDWMKYEVQSALLDLDIKNRESKGK